MNNKKKGNVYLIFLVICILMSIITFSCIYLLYIQINSQVYLIKRDIFYSVQNSIFAINQEELEYSSYQLDEAKLKDNVEKIVKLNNPDKKIEVSYIKYNPNTNKVDIEVLLNVKPVVLYKIIGDINITLKDSVKLKNMEVE